MLLRVKDLGVQFKTQKGKVEVLRGVSFDVDKGEALGLVGESGSGKSVTSLSLLKLLPSTASYRSGKIEFEGQDIVKMSEKQLHKIRGSQISMIFQDPTSSLNPCHTVERQISEVIQIHEDRQRGSLRDRVVELLNMVGIPDPQSRLGNFPHELSGGMSQRIMIAMAMACRPKLLIADEPTTALDVTIQAQVLSLIRKLRQDNHMALILVSHDLGVIAQNTDSVAVMYAGELVELGASKDILQSPQHPYTKGLLASLPAASRAVEGLKRLPQIPGQVPSLLNRFSGCQFQNRCSLVQENCRHGIVHLHQSQNSVVRCLWS